MTTFPSQTCLPQYNKLFFNFSLQFVVVVTVAKSIKRNTMGAKYSTASKAFTTEQK